MQSTLTLALVRSAHPQWNVLRGALTAPPALAIIGDIGLTQSLDALAGRHPTVMLVTADLTTRPPVPLVRDLRALCPASKIILLGATATLDGGALITLHDLGIRGYLVWEDLRPATVRRALLLVVEDDVLVGSPIVLATLRATLERRQGARIDGLVLTSAQRATWTRPPADASPLLTLRQGEVATLLADGYTNAEIGQHLSISAETARKHVQTILRAFGVPSRRTFGRVYRGADTRGREAPNTSEMDDHGGV